MERYSNIPVYAWYEGRDPQLEKAIIRRGNAAEMYQYAELVIKGRWPEAEHILFKNPKRAYWYAADIIKDRWPEAEPYIKKNPAIWQEYKQWWEEEQSRDVDRWSLKREVWD